MGRVTKGNAEAVFEAFGGGGWMIRQHAGKIEGAPADFMADGLTRISMLDAYDGKHYCVLDWHVVSLLIVEGSVAGQPRTNPQIFDQIAARDVVFTLDGKRLATTRTTPRRLTNPQFRGYDEAFYVQVGRVMAPAELPVGTHKLQATGNLFQQPPEDLGSITFVIDEPNGGTCVAPG